MFSLITRLQQKPEPQRRAIALWTTVAITLCIVIVWVVSFFGRVGGAVATAQGTTQDVSPVRSLSEMVSSFGTLIQEKVQLLK